jgi:hypothetical protein
MFHQAVNAAVVFFAGARRRQANDKQVATVKSLLLHFVILQEGRELAVSQEILLKTEASSGSY